MMMLNSSEELNSLTLVASLKISVNHVTTFFLYSDSLNLFRQYIVTLLIPSYVEILPRGAFLCGRTVWIFRLFFSVAVLEIILSSPRPLIYQWRLLRRCIFVPWR